VGDVLCNVDVIDVVDVVVLCDVDVGILMLCCVE